MANTINLSTQLSIKNIELLKQANGHTLAISNSVILFYDYDYLQKFVHLFMRVDEKLTCVVIEVEYIFELIDDHVYNL